MPVLDAKGKPVASRDVYLVEINVYHKPARSGDGRKIQILKAEVDGNMHIINGVLQAAMKSTLEVLIKIGAIKQ